MLLLIGVHVVLMLLSGSKAQSSPDSKHAKEILISETSKNELMNLDYNLILNLESYSYELKAKIKQLKRLARELRKPLKAAKGMEEEYLSNPLHSFSLIRHMHQDWAYIEELMKQPVGQAEIDYLKGILPELPTREDTKDATDAMHRIASTYSMPWEIASGLIDGIQFKGTLSPLDCFEIGKLYFQRGLLKEAYMWFINTAVYEEFPGAHEVLGVGMTDVALMQARTLVELGLSKDAVDVLMHQPDLAKNASTLLTHFLANPHQPEIGGTYMPEGYNMLCRSSHVPSPSRLHCRYNRTTSPFLILAPLKMEEISLDPYIIVYHDVLSVERTEQLIRLGEPRMAPTQVLVENVGMVKDRSRTALGAWVSDHDLEPSDRPILTYITQQMRDISGLKISEITSMQLIKYGFGAHYAPHFDFFNHSNLDVQKNGDRIATVLFYLNDAPHGGGTIFPVINRKVNAERGKALFWYNLKGETHDLDLDTAHGACPVFSGYKYVMSAWLYERDQMFFQRTYREGSRQHFI